MLRYKGCDPLQPLIWDAFTVFCLQAAEPSPSTPSCLYMPSAFAPFTPIAHAATILLSAQASQNQWYLEY